jgi:hypothetical protein
VYGVFLVLVQAVAVVLLTIAGLRLGRDRWFYLMLGTVLLLLATGLDRYHSAESAKREREGFERRIEQLYQALIPLVMTTSKGGRPPGAPVATGQIQILEPLDRTRVAPRQLVTGIADAHLREVRVVVHPLDTGAYWIQAVSVLEKDGRWSVLAYFGRSGDIDAGKVFEVVAVAGLDQSLKEGTVLAGWPKAAQRSSVIRVTRQ